MKSRILAPPGMPALMFLALLLTGPSEATTVADSSFREIARLSSYIVKAEVVSSRVEVRGTAAPPAPQRKSMPPEREPEDAPRDDEQESDAPVAVGIDEAGQIAVSIFELNVEDSIAGDLSGVFEMQVTGGRTEAFAMSVHGMPELVVGETYVLFLRADFQDYGDPFVGWEQGLFRLSTDPRTGVEAIIDGRRNVVVGYTDDDLVARLDPSRADTLPMLLPPPRVREGDSRTEASAQVDWYRHSEDPPMPYERFRELIIKHISK